MPWLETDPVTERERFILEAEGGLFSHAGLCRRHGISRKTGYKWLELYALEGSDGLVDRSHRPDSCPHATPDYVLEAAFALRRRRPTWGARGTSFLPPFGANLNRAVIELLSAIAMAVAGRD